MLQRFFIFSCILAIVAACAPQGGLLVSDDADNVGGNLFVETAQDGSQFLVLDGEITERTSFTFLALVEQADVDGLVIAQSPGGNLLASHQIGREIKARGMNTVVLVSCISACVDIFVAGARREMTDIAELGLHSATDREVSLEIDRRYWREMGFPEVNEKEWLVTFEEAHKADEQNDHDFIYLDLERKR